MAQRADEVVVDEGVETGTYAGAHPGERVRVDTRRRGHADVLASLGGRDGFVVHRLVQPAGVGTPVTAYAFVCVPGEHAADGFMLDVPFVEQAGVLLRDDDGVGWFAPVDGEAVRVVAEPGRRAYGAFSTLGIPTVASFWSEPRFGRIRVTEEAEGFRMVDAILAFRPATPEDVAAARDAVHAASKEFAP